MTKRDEVKVKTLGAGGQVGGATPPPGSLVSRREGPLPLPAPLLDLTSHLPIPPIHRLNCQARLGAAGLRAEPPSSSPPWQGDATEVPGEGPLAGAGSEIGVQVEVVVGEVHGWERLKSWWHAAAVVEDAVNAGCRRCGIRVVLCRRRRHWRVESERVGGSALSAAGVGEWIRRPSVALVERR